MLLPNKNAFVLTTYSEQPAGLSEPHSFETGLFRSGSVLKAVRFNLVPVRVHILLSNLKIIFK